MPVAFLSTCSRMRHYSSVRTSPRPSAANARDRYATIRSMTEPRVSLEETPELTRDFTVATFVVRDETVLLLWHRKLQMWLPPGGHIEPNELPDEAAVREVAEEAGIEVELVGERGVGVERPVQLVRPAGIQLETI